MSQQRVLEQLAQCDEVRQIEYFDGVGHKIKGRVGTCKVKFNRVCPATRQPDGEMCEDLFRLNTLVLNVGCAGWQSPCEGPKISE